MVKQRKSTNYFVSFYILTLINNKKRRRNSFCV